MLNYQRVWCCCWRNQDINKWCEEDKYAISTSGWIFFWRNENMKKLLDLKRNILIPQLELVSTSSNIGVLWKLLHSWMNQFSTCYCRKNQIVQTVRTKRIITHRLEQLQMIFPWNPPFIEDLHLPCLMKPKGKSTKSRQNWNVSGVFFWK